MMHVNHRPLLTISLLLAAAVAGCTDDGPEVTDGAVEGRVDDASFTLEAGKGAMEGLLVDDRFRPIDLEDEPQTEFQAEGFILLQETGQQIQTDENGQFAFVDLEPGTYTLRVTADGYEAIPARVTVEEGLFAEAQILARRTANAEDVILTQEYTAFVPCQASAPAITAQCVAIPPDLSGDTNRQSFTFNYTTYPAWAIVVEMVSNKEASRDGALKVVVRDDASGCYIINDAITEGSYMKTWLRSGQVSPHDVENRNCEWDNTAGSLVQIWAQGLFKEETQPVVAPMCTVDGVCAGTADSRGVGVQAGLSVQFVVSIILGEEDNVDLETYCLLC